MSSGQASSSRPPHLAHLLDQHFDQGERAALEPAAERLRQQLDATEAVISVGAATCGHGRGLLAVTTDGVRFTPVAEAPPSLLLPAEDIAEAWRDGEQLVISRHSEPPARFEQLRSGLWPTILADFIQQLAVGGAAAAIERADAYDNGEMHPGWVERSDSGSSTDQLTALLERHLGTLSDPAAEAAAKRLPDLLAAAETPLRISQATHSGEPGLLLITDRAIHFLPNSVDQPALSLDGSAIDTVRRDGFDSSDIEIRTRDNRQLRFSDLDGHAEWPSECALLISRVAHATPEAARKLAAKYGAGTSQIRYRTPLPARSTATSGTPSLAAEAVANTALLVLGGLALLAFAWLFGFSSVEFTYTDTSMDCLENYDAVFDPSCQSGQYDEDGYPVERYDCGTVGGSLFRSLSNQSGTVFESALDQRCQSKATSFSWPLIGAVVVLGGGWFLLRKW